MNTQTSGVGIGLGGGIGFGSAKTTGVHVTELARKAAPPRRMRVIVSGVWGFVGGFVVGFIVASRWASGPMAVAFLGAGAATWFAVNHNRTVWRPAMNRWSRSFMCERCGIVFEPGA